MDIGNIFRDASLSNLQWLNDGLKDELTYNPKDVDHNRKNDLEFQWGYGDIMPSEGVIDPMENRVTRNLPVGYPGDASPEITWDHEHVVNDARSLMNQGKMGSDVLDVLLSTHGKEAVEKSVAHLRPIFAMEGILGCVAVDATGYDSCADAIKEASQSPNKRFIKHVIGCNCGQHEVYAQNPDLLSGADGLVANGDDLFGFDSHHIENENDSTDGFFEASILKNDKQSVCKSTHCIVIAGQQDLPDDMMDGTLIDLVTMGKIPSDAAKEIKKKDKSAGDKIRAAFRLAYEIEKQSGETAEVAVNPNEHRLADSPMDFDIDCNAEHTAVEVDTVDHNADRELAILSAPQESIGDISGMYDFQDVNLNAESTLSTFLDVDERPGDLSLDVNSPMEALAIDEQTYHEPEFEKTDIISVEEKKEIIPELDVEIDGGFSF